MRSVQLSRLVVLMWCVPVIVQAQESRDFGKARFTVPAGFSAEGTRTIQRFTRVRGRELCLIAVYSDEASPSSLDAAFANAWRTIFSSAGYRRADLPAATAATSPNGDRYISGEGALEDRGGNRFVARLHVFPVASRTQSIVWIGNSDDAIRGCRDEWGTFFSSLRFTRADVARGSGETANPNPPPSSTKPNDASPVRIAAAGATERFERATLSPPVGWGVQRTRDALVLSPPRGRGDEWMQIFVLRPMNPSNGLAAAIAASWRELQALVGAQPMRSVNGTEYDAEGPLRSLRGWNYTRIDGGMRRPEGQFGAQLFVIEVGGRIERVAAFARDFRDMQNGGVMLTSLHNPVWYRAFRDFVFTMQFDGAEERPLAPARLAGSGGGVVGVWGGIAMSFGQLKTHHAIFFDNGTAFFGPRFPTRGLADIIPAAEQGEYPRYWGRWSISNGRGTLSMPYGDVPLRMDANSLVLTTNRTDHRFVRLVMPPERLDGNWCLSDGKCLTFTSAGRFRDGGAARAMEHSVYSYAESPASGEGRYRIVDFTLVLQYDDGKEVRLPIPGSQAATSGMPATLTLGFNEDVLTRR